MSEDYDQYQQSQQAAIFDEQLEYLYAVLSDTPDGEEPFPDILLARLCDNIKENEGRRLALKGSGLKDRVTDREVKKLVRGLIKANIQLEEISLPFHRITDDGFDIIIRLLNPLAYIEAEDGNIQPIRAINLEGNDIQGESLASGILMSSYDCSLRSLDLSGNPLSAVGQINLAQIVTNNRTLYHIAASSCSFNLKGLINLTSNLNGNQTLESLILDRPVLTDTRQGEILEQFSKILENNRSLRALSLKYHDCMDHDARLIANALYTNHSLVHLNLECNKIGVAGAEALASNLLQKGMNSLQFLGLSYNFVSNDGAIALAEVSISAFSLLLFTN